MENILNHVEQFKYVYIIVLLFLLVVIILLLLWKKNKEKVKPIQLEEIEKEQPKSELEDVIQALENNQNSRPMTTFEQEQEENAIISYQELVAAVQDKKMKMQKDEVVEEVIELPTEEIVLKEEPLEPPVKKFKNSEFISPVFGKDTQTNDDFLKELKDLRRNL